MRQDRCDKLALSVQAFNKDDSVAFQEKRIIKGIARELLMESVILEIEKRSAPHRTDSVRILDVGCGSGPWIEAILDYAYSLPQSPRLCITGLDPAQRLIDCARQRLGQCNNVKLEAVSLQSLASSRAFDLVYLVDVLQHFDRRDYEQVFSRLAELLLPGGTVIIIDKEKYSTYALKMKVKKKLYDYPEYYKIAEYPSFRLLRRLGTRFGLIPDRQFRKNHFGCLIMSRPA